MNLIVEDTPIWYDPGQGPKIAFTLTYSNENSNTGIFGPGWRCPYDMRVFFLPGYQDHPTLQVHRSNGRIETYRWNGSAYQPRASTKNYGYRDTIEQLEDDSVVLTLRGGGKYSFMPEGTQVEGRIWTIEDITGHEVVCKYENNKLAGVEDANGRATVIETTGEGINERVTKVTLPDGRYADFGYDDELRLTSIRDMGDYPSTLTYDALAWSEPDYPLTYLEQSITANPLVPANGENLRVLSHAGFPFSGAIQIGDEIITYSGKGKIRVGYEDIDVFKNIVRGAHGTLPGDAEEGTPVKLVSVPYLSTIETLDGKTEFVYQWWWKFFAPLPVVGLREVYEWGPQESYPTVPTWHIQWCSYSIPHRAAVTRYPTSVSPWPENGDGCGELLCQGGVTKYYFVDQQWYDAIGAIGDTPYYPGEGFVVYGYDSTRNRTSIKDERGNTTQFTYDDNRNMLTRTDPLGNTWTYTYENNRIKTARDADNRLVHVYHYNDAGQVTKVETEADGGTPVVLAQNSYDAQGRLEWSKDGREKKTSYHYNEGDETRGFLTSVEDPELKETQYHYDFEGRRDQVTDPNGRTTVYVYDDLDRVVKVIYPDNTPENPDDNPYIENHYTCCHLDWKKDENGRTTNYVYDEKNRLQQIIDPNNGFTIYSYHPVILDRVVAVTDPKEQMTGYDYYLNGRLQKVLYPDNTWEEYEYDAAGNMTRKTDSAGKVTEYTYDENNRLIKICAL